jgi:hypothetical protein
MNFRTLNVTAVFVWLGIAPVVAQDIAAGQQLTFVLSESRPGGEQVAQTYFSQAFPLAQGNGMRELTTFKVQKVLVGEGAPQGSGLYLWPSKEAAQRTRVDDTYVRDLRPLRTQAWIDLKSVDMQITTPLRLQLDRSRTYTAALIWTKNASAYKRQFKASQALRDKAGARTVLHLPASRYENLKDGEATPPDHVVLLEWPTADGPAKYKEDPAFRALSKKNTKNVARIEWYQLGFWD